MMMTVPDRAEKFDFVGKWIDFLRCLLKRAKKNKKFEGHLLGLNSRLLSIQSQVATRPLRVAAWRMLPRVLFS